VKPITAEKRAEIIALAQSGVTRNAIAKQTGVSGGSVTAIARDAGVSFARAHESAAGTQARQHDLRARRARIVDRMYSRMEALQDRLDATEFQTVLKGEGGAEWPRTLDFVPTVDERNIADTLARYTVSAVKLAEVDSDNGVGAVRSLLSSLGAAMGVTRPDE
jgi:transposase-like protein